MSFSLPVIVHSYRRHFRPFHPLTFPARYVSASLKPISLLDGLTAPYYSAQSRPLRQSTATQLTINIKI